MSCSLSDFIGLRLTRLPAAGRQARPNRVDRSISGALAALILPTSRVLAGFDQAAKPSLLK